MTFSGGSRGGWIRAILYLNNVEVARSTGTGSPPRGGAGFPITFNTTAPATPGTYTYQAAWFGNLYDTGNLTAANHGEQRVSTNQFTVSAPTGPVIGTASPLPPGTVGTAYNQTLAATGGTTPYTWSVTVGTLPAGLSLNASTGAITGTPTAAGTSNFTVQVTGGGSSTKAFALTINAVADTVPPIVSPPTSPDNNATGVAVGTNVAVTFSEPILSGSVTATSFILSDGVDNVVGTFSVNGATVTFDPSAPLSDNTTYTATLTTAVTDLAGNPLASNYSWTFTTSAATPAPILPLETSGGGGCAIAGMRGDIKELAGTYGFLMLAALGMALWGRVKRKEK